MPAELNEIRYFRGWFKKCSPFKVSCIEKVYLAHSPILLEEGFSVVKRLSFNKYRPQNNSICFERRIENDTVEEITILFRQYSIDPRYQIIGQASKDYSPFYSIKIANLVRFKDEVYSAKLWGPRPINPFRKYFFERSVKKSSALLPELLEYLDGDSTTPNTWSTDDLG